jgi:hypothetical protein
MGIFAIEVFLLDFPFKGRKRTPLKFSKNKNSVVDVPKKFFTLPSQQRSQWHR